MAGERWNALDRELAAHVPGDEKEARDVRFVRDFLQAHPDDAHLRSQLAGHLTGSAFVLDATGTQLLLLHHDRLDRWLQPGGHGEGELDLRAVAGRELAEETGLGPSEVTPFPDQRILDVDVHPIPANAKRAEPSHLHLDLRYGFIARAGSLLRISSESRALQWVLLERIAAPGGADPSVQRAARKLRASIAAQAGSFTG